MELNELFEKIKKEKNFNKLLKKYIDLADCNMSKDRKKSIVEDSWNEEYEGKELLIPTAALYFTNIWNQNWLDDTNRFLNMAELSAKKQYSGAVLCYPVMFITEAYARFQRAQIFRSIFIWAFDDFNIHFKFNKNDEERKVLSRILINAYHNTRKYMKLVGERCSKFEAERIDHVESNDDYIYKMKYLDEYSIYSGLRKIDKSRREYALLKRNPEETKMSENALAMISFLTNKDDSSENSALKEKRRDENNISNELLYEKYKKYILDQIRSRDEWKKNSFSIFTDKDGTWLLCQEMNFRIRLEKTTDTITEDVFVKGQFVNCPVFTEVNRYCDKLTGKKYELLKKENDKKEDSQNIPEKGISVLKTSDIDEHRNKIPSVEKSLEKLNAMIGLTNAKEQVNHLVNLVRVEKRKKELGLPAAGISSHHLVFTGNPGTGKTTVARIIGDVYKSLGIIKPEGKFIEADRGSLVGKYEGHTAVQVKEIIEEARGGILFIDEAYALKRRGDDDPFGEEAINTLLKEMEDKRDELLVIVAGYTNEMTDFIDSNPGLASRFNTTIEFDDYSADELTQIFEKHLVDQSMKCTKNAEEVIKKGFRKLIEEKDKNFGNGREVRNIFEKIYLNQSSRIAHNIDRISVEALTMFNSEDVAKAFGMKINDSLVDYVIVEKNSVGTIIDKICTQCGKKMVLRKNGKTGAEFYGCSGFPKCKFTQLK